MTNMNYIFYVIWHHSWEQARPNVPVKKQGQACFIQHLLIGLPFTPVTLQSPSILIPPSDQQGIRFPSSTNRQRNLNVNANGPEKEFLKTALDSCHSSIAQNETEIKKLKEAMDIRNKIIL